MPFKVMVAVDGSEHADHAVRAYFHALHRENNEVIFVHVSDALIHGAFGFRPGLGVSMAEWDKMVKESQEKMTTIEKRYCSYAVKKGADSAKLIHANGQPGPKIVELSNKHDVDLIVVGTRGLGSMKRTILGSVSDYILHHSDRTVTVCCEDDEKRSRSGTRGSFSH